MYDNYNYPLGSDTPDAPWNQPIISEKEFDVTCSQTLSKTSTVLTNNYMPGASGVDYEKDVDGGYCANSWQDPDDTSETNWEEEYHDNDHYTPLQLIELFKKHLENEVTNGELPTNKTNKYKHLIEECNGWIEDETEYIEES